MKALGGARGMATMIAMAALAGSARGQAPHIARWQLEGSHGNYCIWYLADPDLAKLMVSRTVVLSPAGSGAGLPPLLMRTVRDEPRFAQWIPGAICIGYYDRVTSDGRTIAQGKTGRPVVIATNTLLAAGAHEVPGAGYYLLDFLTNQGGVARAAANLGVSMGTIRITRRAPPDGEDPEVAIDVAGVQINWSGHPIKDSSVGTTRSVSLGYAGARGTNWLIRFESEPAAARTLAGALEVAGRNTLAKALKASPVRTIGPEESGGSVTVTFQLATPGNR